MTVHTLLEQRLYELNKINSDEYDFIAYKNEVVSAISILRHNNFKIVKTNSRQKITQTDLHYIHKMIGVVSSEEIAKIFNVSRSTINVIIQKYKELI